MNQLIRKYGGVPIPDDLWPNWDQAEASWWRRGVRDTKLASMLSDLPFDNLVTETQEWKPDDGR